MDKEAILYIVVFESGNFLAKNPENGHIQPTQYLKNAFFYTEKSLALADSRRIKAWGNSTVHKLKIAVVE